jgi:hypothetical protein
LSHHARTLIVDQPEDHLDNAYVAGTLVQAIVKRRADSQLLFATHNANIPVLGNASRVFVLGSDGRRGFIKRCGPLDDPGIVEDISSLMEGGREAFAKRAAFYQLSVR